MSTTVDKLMHVRGRSRYVDDIVCPEGTLFGSVCCSSVAHGALKKLNVEPALNIRGVRAVLTHEQVPGDNQIGNVIEDEPLFAEGTVHYRGQPIAFVVADSAKIALAAAKLIEVEYEELPAVFDPREAYERGMLISTTRTLALGDVDSAWDACDVVVQGRVESGAQEHIYLETQSSLAIPAEHGVKLFSSTQAPTAVQKIVARVLGLPMNGVEVEVLRLGGAFGGKEDQATAWAAMVGLAAHLLRKPVKIVLSRSEDIRITGKRHPYSSDFKIGLSSDGKIIGYEAYFYQNAGASADLSTAILERSLFHATNSYYIPNVKIGAACCKTNLPPNTAFRGFGAPQAMFVMESAIHRAAREMKRDPSFIQKKNLIADGDTFPYGMRTQHSRARAAWNRVEKKYGLNKIIQRVDEFNAQHRHIKKGVAVMPICFGISFTTTFLNQASALVHVYTDGSVGISTAAVEMGQGVNEKLQNIAGRVFSIDPHRIKLESTNTTRIANTSPTAASSDVDMNGHAVRIACEVILDRMRRVGSQGSWDDLVRYMYGQRISLSAQAHYATPHIGYDKQKERGTPFAYHVYGASIVEATVDCVRGRYEVDAVKIAHDAGESLDRLIDVGQIEGGLLQGIGWMTIEEIKYAEDGRVMNDTLSTYKVPDINSVPRQVAIDFLGGIDNPAGPFNSKAIGEPPFMYGIGAYFAILNAMMAYRSDLECFYHAPLTHERVLTKLHVL